MKSNMDTEVRQLKPTIRDVAERAKVSTATVSYVINKRNRVGDDTRQRVLDAIHELGYEPNALARGLVNKQTKTLGLIIPHTAEYVFSDPFFPELLKGIGTIASRLGYFLLLSMSDQEGDFTQGCSSIIAQNRVDGVVLMCTPRETQQVQSLIRAQIPMVLVGDVAAFSDKVASVDIDNESGTYELTKHLIELGHKQIGYISGDLSLDYAVLRYRGYVRALQEAGLDSAGFSMGDFTLQSGLRSTRQLFANNRDITGLVCANDLMALGAMQAAATEYGLKVPEDLSVVGFDDIPSAVQTNPPLTTVSQPVRDLGEAAARLLLDIIAGKTMIDRSGEQVVKITLPIEMVVRGSTTNPRKSKEYDTSTAR